MCMHTGNDGAPWWPVDGVELGLKRVPTTLNRQVTKEPSLPVCMCTYTYIPTRKDTHVIGLWLCGT